MIMTMVITMDIDLTSATVKSESSMRRVNTLYDYTTKRGQIITSETMGHIRLVFDFTMQLLYGQLAQVSLYRTHQRSVKLNLVPTVVVATTTMSSSIKCIQKENAKKTTKSKWSYLKIKECSLRNLQLCCWDTWTKFLLQGTQFPSDDLIPHLACCYAP